MVLAQLHFNRLALIRTGKRRFQSTSNFLRVFTYIFFFPFRFYLSFSCFPSSFDSFLEFRHASELRGIKSRRNGIATSHYLRDSPSRFSGYNLHKRKNSLENIAPLFFRRPTKSPAILLLYTLTPALFDLTTRVTTNWNKQNHVKTRITHRRSRSTFLFVTKNSSNMHDRTS